jgi:hypothetical protein
MEYSIADFRPPGVRKSHRFPFRGTDPANRCIVALPLEFVNLHYPDKSEVPGPTSVTILWRRGSLPKGILDK